MPRVPAKLKQVVRGALTRAGYPAAPADASCSLERAFSRIRAADLTPRTMLDVGMARGTPRLHDAFPDAELNLFDPTPASRPHMEAIELRRRASVHPVALGAAPMHILEADSDSSFFAEVGAHPPGTATEVPWSRTRLRAASSSRTCSTFFVARSTG